MIYYQYIISYVNPQNMQARITITQEAENELYTTSLEQTKLIARQQIYVNDKVLPQVFQEVINFLTFEEYDLIVNGPNDLEPNSEIIIPEEDV